MAVVSPSRSEKARPRDALARLFKRHIGEDRFSEEDVALSRILQQTHIAGTPPRKPLPDLPSARTPSHFQHQGLKKLPHSVSLQFPVPGSNVCYYPAAQPSRHLAGPSSSYQIDSLPHMPIASPYIRRDHPASVDHLAVSTLPNPWELTAPKPAPSLPPAFLTSPRPIRPFSAPVLTTKKQPPRRSKSTIVDPLALPGVHQCWGIKRDGTRCTRKVVSATASPRKGRSPSKSPSPSKGRTGGAHADAIVISDSDDDLSDSCSDDDVRREYCFQHSKEINKTDGFVLPGLRRCGSKGRGEGAYVDFGPILAGIVRKGGQEEENCKAQLRTAMCKAPSEVDWVERGYIYIYELRDRVTDSHIALKVGRAINVYKRFEQWRSQCQSKSPHLRAFFPRREGVAQDVLPGAARAEEEGVLLSHKWERLIHIELSYLGKRLDDKCGDCGSRHREIFMIPREIGYDGVQRAVQRWLEFVKVVASDGMGRH